MFKIQFSKDSQKFLQKLSQKKHLLQIKNKIEQLLNEPFPPDSKALHGDLKGRYRVDVGEYRIIYCVDTGVQILQIILIGKRNDGEVYKKSLRK